MSAIVINTRNQPNTEDADELVLYTTNDAGLYRIAQQSYIPNMARRMRNGSYNRELAIKLWFYFAQKAAKQYKAMFGGKFNTATLMNAADAFRDYYHEDAEALAMAPPIDPTEPVIKATHFGWR